MFKNGTMSLENFKFLQVSFLVSEQYYGPDDVKRLRKWLNLSQSDFAEFFHQSEESVKAWEAPEGSDKHREVSGAAARVMQFVEWMATEKRRGKIEAFEKALKTARYRGIVPR